MGESSQRCRRRSKQIKEQSFPVSLFGECIIVVARGIKPGDWLSRQIGCTERHANLLIAGKRKPNARAILALNAALLDGEQ